MWVYVCVYAHTLHMEYPDVSLWVGMRHLEGPKNPDGLNLGIYVFVCVNRENICMYMQGL